MPKKSEPDLTPLKSSALNGYHYDDKSRALTVEFTNGARHVYDDVSAEKVEALSTAGSPGRYFAERIKEFHPSRKLRDGK